MSTSVLASMVAATTSLHEVADMCPDLKLREVLRERAKSLAESHAPLADLIGTLQRIAFTKAGPVMTVSLSDVADLAIALSHIGEATPEAVAGFIDPLIDQVTELKRRACHTHALCNELRIKHPEIPELGDDGSLHEAIHDVLRVETPMAREDWMADAERSAAMADLIEASKRARRALAWAAEQRSEFVAEYEAMNNAVARFGSAR